VTEIATILRQEVHQERVISFARFMDQALYCPNLGYYEQEDRRIGRSGDFYTSVSIGPLFGQLLAYYFARWRAEGALEPWQLVEAGAHDGQLALDVLSWLEEHRPEHFDRLEYWLVEPSRRRRRWQGARLEEFAGRVRWVDTLEGMPQQGVTGVIFSNELLDAFPLHRVAWDAKTRSWFEWGVGMSEDRFAWQRMEKTSRDWPAELKRAGIGLPEELSAVLPDGFTIDLCPAAGEWWRMAAAALRHGRLLTFDYGLAAHEILRPERSQGTLRAYHRHQARADVLQSPGDFDLTAHVNFTQLQRAGESVGLTTDGLYSQEEFLTRIAEAMWQEKPAGDAPSPGQVRQFQSLTHPERLGLKFRVLVQSRLAPKCAA